MTPWYVNHTLLAGFGLTVFVTACVVGLIYGAAELGKEQDREDSLSDSRASGHLATPGPAHVCAVPALRADQSGSGARPRLDPATAPRKRVPALVERADPRRI